MQLNQKLFEAALSGKRYVIHQGGTGAGKTFTNLQYLIIYAIKYPRTSISLVGKTMPHLKRGCIRDIRRIIEEENLSEFCKENKTESVFQFTNGSYIECFPADNAAKLRGPKRDILFINECNNISHESFQQLDVRTRKRTLMDYNPVRRFWVHDKLMPLLKPDEYEYMQSTYRDNPHITPQETAGIERRRGNLNWWRVYGEGEIGNAEGVVFTNWEITAHPQPFPVGREKEQIQQGAQTASLPTGEGWGGAGTLLGYGIDFGFVHSPTAIVQVSECNGELYVKELFYKTGAQNDEIFAFVEKNLDLNARAIADSAEPKAIDYLYRKGWRGLKPCVKGSDSVTFGLYQLLERKINVIPESPNFIKELRDYMWDTDKDGNPINRPIKLNDHAIDALRYVYTYPPKRKLIVV